LLALLALLPRLLHEMKCLENGVDRA